MNQFPGIRILSTCGMLLAFATSIEAKSGWSGPPLEKDRKEGARPCDWTEFHARADKEGLRIAYRCAESIDFNRGAAYCVYLDTDGDRGTGFRGGEDTFPIGAEYLLQGASLYRYSGDGLAWSWSTLGEVPFELAGDWAELTLTPELFQATADTIRVFLMGDNTADGVGGNFVDEMPDGALRKGGGGKFIRIKLR